MIFLKNITVSYNKKSILQNFSLTLPEQGAVCLFAPSGSGKTTLLSMIAGLKQGFSGQVQGLKGKKVSVVFQENRLLPGVTALSNVSVALPKGQEQQAAFWLEQVGLREAANLLPEELSGGMQRRVAIARALAWGGDIYLLDEPFQGLDQELKNKLMDIIRSRAKGSLVVLVTHSWESALTFADQVVVCSGQPMEIQKQFAIAEPYGKRDTAALLAKYGQG